MSLAGSSGGGSSRATAASVVRQTSVRISALRNVKGKGGIVGASHGVEKPGFRMSSHSQAVDAAIAKVLAQIATLGGAMP